MKAGLQRSHRVKAALSVAALALAGTAAISLRTPNAAMAAAPPAPAKAVERPNVLFILVDDLGNRDFGYSGSTFDETPNIDALAKRSARFDAAYSASPVCSPSRAALLTGQDPARLGITTWIPGGEYQNMPLIEPSIKGHLPANRKTIAEYFKDSGYTTFFAGKWHLGGAGYLPSDRGFDTNIGGGEYGQPPHGYYAPYHNAYLKDGPPGEYLTDRLANDTISYLSSRKTGDKPFFAFLSFYAVHTPIEPAPGPSYAHFQEKAAHLPAALSERKEGFGLTRVRQDNAAYASMVYSVDRNVGRVLEALDRLGLRKNTIVVLTSDNGGLSTLDPTIDLYKSGTPTSNEPLRAGKGFTYEGGIEVPLLVDGPGIERRRIATPMVLTDLFPTLLDMAHIRHGASDGQSLVRVLAGGRAADRRTLFWHFPHYHGSGARPASAIRRGNWKLVRDYESDRWELFDLNIDSSETIDLSARRPQVLAMMKSELQRKLAATGAKLPIRRSAGK